MKKEIIIDGSASDWFEKATFILKDTHANVIPKDLMSYAEEIVENHMKKVPESKALPTSDFIHQRTNAYQKAQRAYHEQIKKEYARISKEKEVLKKRAKHVNTFVTLSIIACILSLIALALSSIG